MRQGRERVHSPSNRRTSPWPRLLISGEHFKPMSQNHTYSRLKCKRGTLDRDRIRNDPLPAPSFERTRSVFRAPSQPRHDDDTSLTLTRGRRRGGGGGGSSRNSEFGIRRVCRIAPLACCCHLSLTTASLLDEPRVKFISASIFSEFNGNSHSCCAVSWRGSWKSPLVDTDSD